MESDVEHDALDDALRRCGANWDAAQSHGLLSSRLALVGANAEIDWLQLVLDGTDVSNASKHECESMLKALYRTTYRQLSERLSEFTPLLPDDADSAGVRAHALGHWCEGYLHGLVSIECEEAVRQRLAAEPIAEIIKDMLQITRAGADGDDADETDEASYTEIVEYLRVAAQLVFEELSSMRPTRDQG